MHNRYNKNVYKPVKNYECQYLCQITEGCYYYNYKRAGKECYLKYGMGEKIQIQRWNKNDYKFGHKKSPIPVDVNCEFVFTSCSVSCGGGVRNKYILTDQRGGGDNCSEEEEPCNEAACPVDCRFQWSSWSRCSPDGGASCGNGVKSREPLHKEGTKCPEPEKVSCYLPCPVPCEFYWSPWTRCSAPCVDKDQKVSKGVRRRSPKGKRGPYNNGKSCPNEETETCWGTDPCPVNCEHVWTDWSGCDCTEEEGKRTRTRSITVPAANHGQDCPEDNEEDKKENCVCEAEAGFVGALVVVVVVLVLVLIIILATGGGYYLYKKRNVITVEGDHHVLVKDNKLKEKLNELTENPRVLFKEFQHLETELKNTVPDTTVLGEINIPHNRYGDIGE